MKNYNTMLHMKLNSAVSVFAVAAAFSVFLPSPAYSGVCFLPDCAEEDLSGEPGMDINSDSKYCEENGYVSSCPENTARIPDSTCYRDDNYFKCSKQQWCKDNGYNISSCSIPQYLSEQCPNGENLYKSCKTDNQRACQDLGYKNSCPSGQKLKKNSGRCAYDSSYGTCCTPTGCPSYTSLTSSSYGTNGTDGCEYTCYYTCNMNCPSGTSTSNPGGCGGSTRNGCGTKTCYYPYKACCTPSCTSQYGCSCGTYTVSNGCGGTCTKCSSCCTPKSNETGCSCGTYSCSDGCGGTRKCCSTCSSSSGGSSSSDVSVGIYTCEDYGYISMIPRGLKCESFQLIMERNISMICYRNCGPAPNPGNGFEPPIFDIVTKF